MREKHIDNIIAGKVIMAKTLALTGRKVIIDCAFGANDSINLMSNSNN